MEGEAKQDDELSPLDPRRVFLMGFIGGWVAPLPHPESRKTRSELLFALVSARAPAEVAAEFKVSRTFVNTIWHRFMDAVRREISERPFKELQEFKNETGDQAEQAFPTTEGQTHEDPDEDDPHEDALDHAEELDDEAEIPEADDRW